MVVRKILEETLIAGNSSVSFTDADIPNSLIRVFSSNADIIPVSRNLTGNTLTVVYAPQSNNIDVAVEIVKAGLDIVDNLTSTDADKALSAKQGNLLNIAIEDVASDLSDLAETVNNLDIPDNITDLDDVVVTDIEVDQVLAWDGTKFVNVDQSGGGSDDGDVYSTSEIVVGKWINNEPIYRKVIDFGTTITIPYNSWNQTGQSIQGITTVLKAFVPSYGSVMCGIYNTNMLLIQTARNGDTAFAQYLIVDYLK